MYLEQYEQTLALWRSFPMESPSDVDKHLISFRILFAYNSGKLENDAVTYHDTREIFENGKVSGFNGNPTVLLEQQNQRMCYELLKSKIIDKEPLSVNLIKEIHFALTMGTYDQRRYIDKGERPGEYKRGDYITGIHEVGSAAQDVEADVAALIDEMNAYDGADILKAAAYLHARFEYIHPFADGNGRTGRTLLNYCLMINNHPPLIIYDEDKHDYYAALQKYDESEEITPLYNFIKRQCVKTWTKTLDLANGAKPVRKGLSDM
jgi:Fic family protein